jgi:drug/metabolite transporter (DMT)-like permease
MTPTSGSGYGLGQLHGILLMLAASLTFSVLDMQAKYLSQTQPVMQIAWARYFGHFVLMMIFLWPKYGRSLLKTENMGLQFVRSILLLLCTFMFFTAVSLMPLADAVAISFASPMIATALSVPLLKEQVGMRRWIAVLIGFGGVLIIVRPGSGIMNWAALLVLATAFFFALFQLITRMLANREDNLVTLFYSAIIGAVILTAIVPFYWLNPPGWQETVMLAGLGLFGGFGHYLLIKAHEYAPIAVLSPLSYSSLIWSVILGYIVFTDFPDFMTLIGAGILIATGVYIVYREGIRAS